MQDDILQKMAAKGWYPSEQAEPQKIQQVKQNTLQMLQTNSFPNQ